MAYFFFAWIEPQKNWRCLFSHVDWLTAPCTALHYGCNAIALPHKPPSLVTRFHFLNRIDGLISVSFDLHCICVCWVYETSLCTSDTSLTQTFAWPTSAATGVHTIEQDWFSTPQPTDRKRICVLRRKIYFGGWGSSRVKWDAHRRQSHPGNLHPPFGIVNTHTIDPKISCMRVRVTVTRVRIDIYGCKG